MLLIGGYGFLSKQLEIKSAKASEVPELEKQIKEVKKENEELRVETQASLSGKIIKEIRRVFGSKSDEAIKIISCENNPDRPNYDPYRININRDSSLDYGVFQINSLWERIYGAEFKKDWKKNIEIAKKIFDRSGSWRYWYSSDSCHKLTYK